MKISVVGSINMDMTVTAPRIPGKGETILGEELHFKPGGKGANQAYALGKLGADVAMFGCVGQDDFGRQLIDNLRDVGVKTDFIRQEEDVKTGVALITVGDRDNSIVVVPGANSKVTKDYIDSVKDDLLQSSLVIMQLEIPLDTVLYVCELCAEKGIDVLLNPAPAIKLPEKILRQVSFITPNEHEAALVYDHEGPIEPLLQRYPGQLIVTLGPEGTAMADKSGEIIRTPAGEATVVDTTGAGDTFNGAFAFAYVEGQTIEQALLFANMAAGMSTEKLGAQAGMPDRASVQARLDSM